MAKNPHTTSNRDQAHDTERGTTATSKSENLETYRSDATGHDLRTNQGTRIADNHNSLKAGERGPTLMEDFIFREKMNHFDHERIPERIVHARGAAAHGYFQPYEAAARYSKAGLFKDPGKKTPVFVRFSTVQGARGSNDTVRDVRGFATKFYTDEGNWDLVGNNMPVFFIQDAMKFPDLVHAVKPEPHNEIPQGQSAHDTFWDFVSLMPESAHMVLWTMSDRAFPRHYRYMEGFGVHTFRLIDRSGKARFVKFHWKPLAGTHSLIWDEAQKLWGRDPDFNRREMWGDIENGDVLEWELGIQVVEEEDEHAFDFDILDPTKLIPEEVVPVTPIGKMVLDRNPDNYFAETEQVAFNPGNVVPGIDFSNDPLLQGRLFSYLDTQMLRLGGPNFHEIPINQPVCPFHNHQRDAPHRQTINKGQVSYEPNSIDDGWPRETPPADEHGGYESYHERIDAHKIRGRSESFGDHYSQARLFWHSQTPVEQEHIIAAYAFELSKVERPWIRERVIREILPNIDMTLARRVGEVHGVTPPDHPPAAKEELGTISLDSSPSLSLLHREQPDIRYRKVAILAADGVDGEQVEALQQRLEAEGAQGLVIAPSMAAVKTLQGGTLTPDAMLNGLPSVTLDAVVVAPGEDSAKTLAGSGLGLYYVQEAYKHLKPIAALGDGAKVLQGAGIEIPEEGVFSADRVDQCFADFREAMRGHRVWARDAKANDMPA
ncbi:MULTISPECIES: catalase HPII [unclassified Halomonas]|uniref:catalase HPII n=1 Tax=unclassified Halomonas TaxID=2609666 RepID=UPI001C977205|nr:MULTISPECIES: catalase HPII [unclassified Halomonas]MBY5926878.1 catalase HPII [Halomonas sp. DP4Y7-2]MBY6233920.1 catalase HPII [Halomonas sp. DP4Y7-1]